MENNNLQPEALFGYFLKICEIPHGSKNEAQISAYLQNFGKELGFETIADGVGNVLIKKPATPGYENRKTIILQSHMDMVCDKRPDVDHDFTKDAIKPYVDGEWLKAQGTTLGADNGIGVAAAMAVLADKTLKHGPVNCLFTIDEETGLTGAEALSPELLQGDILVNLDSEDEGEMFIGCAGGVCNYAEFKHMWTTIAGNMFFMKVDIAGLTGGHSGDDIDKGRANANKLLNRFLCRIANKYEFYLCDISGGSLHNAIPRDASAVIAVPSADKESVRVDFNIFAAEVQDEYAATEPNMRFTLQSTEGTGRCIDPDVARGLLKAVHAVFNGVFAMSQDMPGLVETSSNLSIVEIGEGKAQFSLLVRSSSESMKMYQAISLYSCFSISGMRVELSGSYSGWQPNVDSHVLAAMKETYKELFGKEPEVKVIHAGLECGILSGAYPHWDMVSCGPTLMSPHSPDERANIPSVAKCWEFLKAVLENIPTK